MQRMPQSSYQNAHMKLLIILSLILIFVSLSHAAIEVSCHWTNAVGAPKGHIYEMQVSYDGAKTWEALLDNIPSSDGTTSVVMPEILGKAYQVRVRAWDSTEKNFTGLWSDPSERFMLMYFVGPPEFVGVIR